MHVHNNIIHSGANNASPPHRNGVCMYNAMYVHNSCLILHNMLTMCLTLLYNLAGISTITQLAAKKCRRIATHCKAHKLLLQHTHIHSHMYSANCIHSFITGEVPHSGLLLQPG